MSIPIGSRVRRALSHRVAVGVLVLAVIYSWVAAGFRPFTWPMYGATILAILVLLVPTWRRMPTVPEDPPGARRGMVVWTGLLVVTSAWELVAYFSSPRQDHPTLSTFADDAMRTHPGRAAVLVGWLGLGWVLLVRSRMASAKRGSKP